MLKASASVTYRRCSFPRSYRKDCHITINLPAPGVKEARLSCITWSIRTPLELLDWETSLCNCWIIPMIVIILRLDDDKAGMAG
jgi:hypothetical protein